MDADRQSEEIDKLAETLASRTRLSKADAVKRALTNELDRVEHALPLRDRVRSLQDRVLAWPDTGAAADKTFYDDLNG